MIKSLLKLLAILVIGILIYNYFLGTPSEKEGAQKIFREFKDVGVAVTDLLKSEKQKFDAGKYDNAVNKIGDLLDGLKRNAQDFDEQYLQRIKDLEKKREELSRQLSEYQQEDDRINQGDDKFTPKSDRDSSGLKRDLQKLLDETEQLIQEMQSKQ
ncbi:MAG: hypothetical protein ACE5FF_00825 [Saprospiraceae bacterium]